MRPPMGMGDRGRGGPHRGPGGPDRGPVRTLATTMETFGDCSII